MKFIRKNGRVIPINSDHFVPKKDHIVKQINEMQDVITKVKSPFIQKSAMSKIQSLMRKLGEAAL